MWFDKRKTQDNRADNLKRSNIEIIANRKATKEIVRETQEVNDRLKDLFLKNHFTIKIFLAAGGRKNK